MRKIHLTTKDTKSTKFREIIPQTFVSFATFVVTLFPIWLRLCRAKLFVVKFLIRISDFVSFMPPVKIPGMGL